MMGIYSSLFNFDTEIIEKKRPLLIVRIEVRLFSYGGNMYSNPEFIKSDLGQKENQLSVTLDNFSFCPANVLGRGCYGSVFRGLKHPQQENVAIKAIEHKRITTTIQKVLLENEKSVVRLLIDRKIRGATRYEKIVETKTHTYLIMALNEGSDMEKMLKAEKMSQIKARELMVKILNAYIELRSINVVHRDLKPANILIDQTGKVEIADFGFAVVQEEDSKKYTYSLGSPVYCSPESLLRFQYGVKSDIWAIGTIAYKLLTGKTPWKGKSNKDLIENIKSQPIQTLLAGIKDEKMRKLICGCCEFDVQKRNGLAELEKLAEQLNEETIKPVQNEKLTPQKAKQIKKPVSLKSERKKSMNKEAENNMRVVEMQK